MLTHLNKKGLLVIFLTIVTNTSYAQKTALKDTSLKQSTTNTNTFIRPVLIKRSTSSYPPLELKKNNSGSALLTFMVDKEGNTFEPLVINSTAKAFEKYAVTAVNNYKFEPATLNKQPIESVFTVNVLFLVHGQRDNVSQIFNRSFKKAKKELKKKVPNQKNVLKNIISMEKSTNMTPYSHAYLNLVKQDYFGKLGDKQSQIDALNQIFLFESKAKNEDNFLDKESKISMGRLLTLRYIETQQYAAAINTYTKLNKVDPEAKSMFQDAFTQINDIYISDKITSAQINITENGYTTLDLFKNKFGFENTTGEIKNIKLRCDKKFASLDYSTDLEFQIPASWGKCQLEVIGNPYTQSIIYQY